MRQDLTNQPLYKELSKAGMPDQIALRAAWLIGGRRTDYVDFHSRPNTSDDILPFGTLHEVVAITDGRIAHVLVTEFDAPDAKGHKFAFHVADVWSRNTIAAVTASGDESAWEDLLSDQKMAATLDPLIVRALRRYVLSFTGRTFPVTIPLSHRTQNDADQVASCLAYEVKNTLT